LHFDVFSEIRVSNTLHFIFAEIFD